MKKSSLKENQFNFFFTLEGKKKYVDAEKKKTKKLCVCVFSLFKESGTSELVKSK